MHEETTVVRTTQRYTTTEMLTSVCIDVFGIAGWRYPSISSFTAGSHVKSFRVGNRSGIKFVIPKDYSMGANIEGGDVVVMAGELLRFFGDIFEISKSKTRCFNAVANGS